MPSRGGVYWLMALEDHYLEVSAGSSLDGAQNDLDGSCLFGFGDKYANGLFGTLRWRAGFRG